MKCAIGLGLLILLDFIWLFRHQSQWWSSRLDNLLHFGILRKILIITSYLLIVVRLLVLYSIHQTYSQTDSGDDEFLYQEE